MNYRLLWLIILNLGTFGLIFLVIKRLAFLLRHQKSSSILNQFFILRLNS